VSDNLSRLQLVREGLAREHRQIDSLADLAGSGGPREPPIDERVSRLEVDMKDLKSTLARLEPMIIRIDAQVPHLATNVEFATTKTDIERLRGDVMTALASKPGRGDMWTMGIALFALVAGAMAAGAIWLPLAMRLLHVQG
jgi:hypothetical protein